MTRKTLLLSGAAAAALAAAGGLLYLRGGMQPPEVLRKLSGLRISLALYAQEHRQRPAAFEDTIKAGQLEGAPALKLPWHRGTSEVKNVPSAAVSDTGGWAYVNEPADPAFGTIFIDCSHKDGKGRYWSEF